MKKEREVVEAARGEEKLEWDRDGRTASASAAAAAAAVARAALFAHIPYIHLCKNEDNFVSRFGRQYKNVIGY